MLPEKASELHPPVWLVCRQPAGRISLQPQEKLPSCCVCSSPSSHSSILPGRPVKPCTPPPLSLFLRSTGLVKVSQSPVALLYRLQCFLFKWRLLSCEYPCKDWPCCFAFLHLLFGYFGLKPKLISVCLYFFFCLRRALRSAVLDHDYAMQRLLCVT